MLILWSFFWVFIFFFHTAAWISYWELASWNFIWYKLYVILRLLQLLWKLIQYQNIFILGPSDFRIIWFYNIDSYVFWFRKLQQFRIGCMTSTFACGIVSCWVGDIIFTNLSQSNKECRRSPNLTNLLEFDRISASFSWLNDIDVLCQLRWIG